MKQEEIIVPYDSTPHLHTGSFLTKEQAEQFKDCFKDIVAVVRCRDCEHWDDTTEECSNEKTACYRNGYCPGDWFCADGERKGSV